MPEATGSRRQLLTKKQKDQHAQRREGKQPAKPASQAELARRPLKPSPGSAHPKAKPTHPTAPAPSEAAPVGNLQIHARSRPALQEGQSYTITASQSIKYVDEHQKEQPAPSSDLQISKPFKALGNRSTLDASLIHSVYPPPGHSEYWPNLPHVLFTDPETPWLFGSKWWANDPWLALFIFTHDELSIPDISLSALGNQTKPSISSPMQGANLSVTMTNAQFTSLAPSTARPLGSGDGWLNESMQAIFVKNELLQALLPKAADLKFTDKSPWLMSHVRSVTIKNMLDTTAADSGVFGVTVSQRTGPTNLATASTAYAHLVTIPGPDNSGAALTNQGLTGLCSLYSWTYNSLPTDSLSFTSTFQNLGQNIQPLRMPKQALSEASSEIEAWIMDRLKAGYSLGRYRPLSGEVSMCIFRGLLIPESPYEENSGSLPLPSSDYGSDLAIIDKSSGLIDVTYQMAWTLGRSVAMSDRTFAGALMRTRGTIHNAALTATKKRLDQDSVAPVQKSIHDSLQHLAKSSLTIRDAAHGRTTSNFKSRWAKAPLRPSSRDVYSFAHDEVKSAHVKSLSFAALSLAAAGSPDPHAPSTMQYDETTPPASTDWATVFAWIMDKWYLGGIPILNLIPDPSFVPKESIRTFYIDPIWLTAFMDGALSIAEHRTDQDDTREAIKAAFDVYLTSNVSGKSHPPQMPRYGLFLRSELVKKFPNLHITAPIHENSSGLDELLRVETLDQDLLVVLFDRVPGQGQFPDGITIAPPGHQLSFVFGNSNGNWNFTTTPQKVTQSWRSVLVPPTFSEIDPATGYDKAIYSSDHTPPIGFDFHHNALLPADLARDARTAVKVGVDSDSRNSLLGAQFVAAFPKLTIADSKPQGPRGTAGTALTPTGWICSADSEQATENLASNVVDGDPSTIWQTQWRESSPGLPHWIMLDMRAQHTVCGVTYLPRQDDPKGRIVKYELHGGSTSTNLSTLQAGSWSDDFSLKTATFSPVALRYIQLIAVNAAENTHGPWASAAEIQVIGADSLLPANSLRSAERPKVPIYPPLVGQDPRPVVPAPPAPPGLSPISSKKAVAPPKLLQLLASVEVSQPADQKRYLSDAQPCTAENINAGDSWLDRTLNLYVHNLRYQSNGNTIYKLVKPAVAGYFSDLHFSLTMRTDIGNLAYIYSRVEIHVSMGTGPTDLLQPFPSFAPSSNSTAPISLNDPSIDAPLRTRVNGVQVPTVQFIGRGNRYRLQTTVTANEFIITLYPNVTPPSPADVASRYIYNNRDLSFVIQDVFINAAGLKLDGGPSPTTCVIQEIFSQWDQKTAFVGQAATKVLTPTYWTSWL